MDVSGTYAILPTQSFTLAPFLPIPVDSEYPGQRFRSFILTRSPGDTYAHYHLRNTALRDD